jgi:hypothetical protein
MCCRDWGVMCSGGPTRSSGTGTKVPDEIDDVVEFLEREGFGIRARKSVGGFCAQEQMTWYDWEHGSGRR